MSKLPEKICVLIAAIAKAVQCDPAIVFAAFLGVISSAVVGRFKVRPSASHNYAEAAQLYIIMQADSGERKNSAVRILAQPLTEKLYLLRRQNSAADARIAVEQAYIEGEECESVQGAVEAQHQIKELEERKAPKIERIVTNFSLQSMAYEQEKTGGKFVFINAESTVLSVISGDLYGGREGTADLDNFLNSFDNEAVVVNRVGKSIDIPRGSASFLIGSQPSKVFDFMTKNIGHGVHERFLYFLAPDLSGTRTCFSDDVPTDVYDDYCLSIEMLAERNRHSEDLETILFSDEAESAYIRFFTLIEKRIHKGGDLSDKRITGWVNRLRSNVVRIAGLLALYLGEQTVSLSTWNTAETLAIEYLIPCAKMVFGIEVLSASAKTLASHLTGIEMISQADFYRRIHGLSGMNKNVFRDGIDELEAADLIHLHEQKKTAKTGRIPSPIIEAHPDIEKILM